MKRTVPGHTAGQEYSPIRTCHLEGLLLDWLITADENDQIARRWLL